MLIEIDLQGDRYVVTVWVGDDRSRCECNFSATDLSIQYKQLVQKAERVLFGDEGSLYALAEAGYFLFCQVFSTPKIREKIRTALQHGGINDPNYIAVHSERCVLPWSFLYLERPEKNPISPEKFLGYYSITSIDITDPEVAEVRPEPRVEAHIDVLAAHCDQLQYSVRREIPFLKKLVKRFSARATFLEFPELTLDSRGKVSAENDALARQELFSPVANIIHFACHASNDSTPDQNFIRLRKNYPLTHMALHSESERFQTKPFIFLNACDIGFVDPLKFTSFVRFFLERGARTVVAPDCRINDLSSARFSQALYKFLARGQPVMNALFSARHDILRKHNDYIGFAYALYGQSNSYLAGRS